MTRLGNELSLTKKQYQAKLDSKKRITIRSPRTEYYVVTEENDGTIILSPRVLVHPDEISLKTVSDMDNSIKNFKERKISNPIDLEELRLLSK